MRSATTRHGEREFIGGRLEFQWGHDPELSSRLSIEGKDREDHDEDSRRTASAGVCLFGSHAGFLVFDRRYYRKDRWWL